MSVEMTFTVRAVLVLIAVGLMVTGICRARYMSRSTTVALIRYAAAAQFVSGLVLLLCATVKPDWATSALILAPSAALFAQAASARYWRAGLPAPFRSNCLREIDASLLHRVAGGSDK